jgi:hypothetical protein
VTTAVSRAYSVSPSVGRLSSLIYNSSPGQERPPHHPTLSARPHGRAVSRPHVERAHRDAISLGMTQMTGLDPHESTTPSAEKRLPDVLPSIRPVFGDRSRSRARLLRSRSIPDVGIQSQQHVLIHSRQAPAAGHSNCATRPKNTSHDRFADGHGKCRNTVAGRSRNPKTKNPLLQCRSSEPRRNCQRFALT